MTAKTQIKAAANGDIVQVDYIGKLENGTVFDTSIEAEAKKAGLPLRPSYSPLEFTVGAGQMIAGFDAGVVGMSEGQEKTVSLPPEQAYGMPSSKNIVSVPLASIGNYGSLQVGSHISASNGMVGTVTNVSNTTVTVDFNHELAGKTLVFSIKMVRIEKK